MGRNETTKHARATSEAKLNAALTASASKEKVSSDLSAACQMRFPPGPVTYRHVIRVGGRDAHGQSIESIESSPEPHHTRQQSTHTGTPPRTVTSTGA